ncbi:MAG: hypothetical protein AAGF88_05430 [Pseudomonadota bacterium]
MKPGYWALVIAPLALAACARGIPDDTVSGVGFGDYQSYQQSRLDAQAQLAGRPTGVVAPSGPETIVPPLSTQSSAPITSVAAAAIAEAETQPQVASADGAVPAPLPSNTAAISDEQDFDAVAARETIETDAERLARMADQRIEVAPTDVPDRPGSTGPNIVEYALATTHPVGQQVYRRSGLRAGRHEANCLSYQSADLAQQAFLSMGGPERDRRALDPDGDGYACSWDPNIYRSAARGG